MKKTVYGKYVFTCTHCGKTFEKSTSNGSQKYCSTCGEFTKLRYNRRKSMTCPAFFGKKLDMQIIQSLTQQPQHIYTLYTTFFSHTDINTYYIQSEELQKKGLITYSFGEKQLRQIVATEQGIQALHEYLNPQPDVEKPVTYYRKHAIRKGVKGTHTQYQKYAFTCPRCNVNFTLSEKAGQRKYCPSCSAVTKRFGYYKTPGKNSKLQSPQQSKEAKR